MKLRQFHKTLGLSLSPLFLLAATTGLALLWRKDNLYSQSTKTLLIRLHTWEILAKYSGSILAVGLMTTVGTGLVLTLRPELKKMRYRQEIKMAQQRRQLARSQQTLTESPQGNR